MRSDLQESQVTGPSAPVESMLSSVPGAKTIALIAMVAISTGLATAGVAPAPFQAVAFEPNVGQTDGRAEFIARAPNASLWLTRDGVVLSVLEKGRSRRAVLKLRFEGAKRTPRIEAEDPQPDVSNYFLGQNPRQWHTGVRHFGKVRYRNIYPGIDAVFYGNPRELEYDLVVQPGADPSKIRLAFDGPKRISLAANGDLVLHFGGLEIRNRKPRIYQRDGSGDRSINGCYRVLGERLAGFAIERYDATKPLVVDPVMAYGTFLGGSGGDTANAIATDAQGNVYVAGGTTSPDLPVRSGLDSGLSNTSQVAFVAKINPSASGSKSLVYATFLGGSVDDEALGIAVDTNGNAYVTGRTVSADFPLKNAFQTTISTTTNCGNGNTGGTATGCPHAFVSKISAAGNALVYSSYLGGSKEDDANAIAVDAAGNAYITGETLSTDFPTSGSTYQGAQKGAGDAFLSEVAASGASLLYSTYFGGTGQDAGNGIAVTASGTVYIVGSTGSTDLPVTSNALQGKAASSVAGLTPVNGNGFLTKFVLGQSGAQQVSYSTYLGGANGLSYANAVAVDSAGAVYVTGATWSPSFPVSSGAYEPKFAGVFPTASGAEGPGDAFVTKLDLSAQASAQVVYSTYLGGALNDQGVGIAVDPAGIITVVGQTESTGFPITADAFQNRNDGPTPTEKGFLSRIDPSKSGTDSLLYSTYLGGTSDDLITGVVIDGGGKLVTVSGMSLSYNAPVTPSAFQSIYHGGGAVHGPLSGAVLVGDAYIAQFDFSANGPFCRSITNSASLTGSGLSPGLLFTIRGSGLGPAAGQGAVDTQGTVATTLAGVQVLVGGTPVPLLYVQEGQINAVAPNELVNRIGDLVNAQVIYNGVVGNLCAGLTLIASPAIFTLGNGQGAILNQDGSLNGPDHPAAKGSTIQIYATGLGPTYPSAADGQLNTPVLSTALRTQFPVSVTIGGALAANTYAVPAPGYVEGVFVVNAIVPASVPSGNVPVVLTVLSVTSPPASVVVQ